MASEIKVLDSIPGSGKTTAIFNYMASDPKIKWLYLSPMLSEVSERVPAEADRVNMAFSIPEDEIGNKASQVLQFLKDGDNIACTHALTLYFTNEHIELIKLQGYHVVCDEELNLIEAYNISKEDVEFLYSKNLLRKDIEKFGKLEFLDKEMPYSTRYGDIKRLCDRGCLYGEKNSDTMLVTYLSPDLVLSAKEFILLTYNFGGSVMDAFSQLHGVGNSKFELELYRSNQQCKQDIKELLEFCETPALKKLLIKQSEYSLSTTWWKTSGKKREADKAAIKSIIRGLYKFSKVESNCVFMTVPVDSIPLVKSKGIGANNHVAFNCRATNLLSHKKHAIHAYNIFVHTTVKSYLSSYGFAVNEESYALNTMIQWLFRGCIRNREPMKISILSSRMKTLLSTWLDDK